MIIRHPALLWVYLIATTKYNLKQGLLPIQIEVDHGFIDIYKIIPCFYMLVLISCFIALMSLNNGDHLTVNKI